MRAPILTAILMTGLAAAALTGPATAAGLGPAPSLAASDGLLTSVRARHHVRRHVRHHRMRRSARMPAGSRFNNVTRGAIAGDSGGNAVTGSTAAPSGR